LPNIRLHVYGLSGDSNYFHFLGKLIEDLQIEEQVQFFESVRHEELSEIYSISDVGVVPKRGGIFSSEAFSTKIFDFMAVGLPAIVSRTKIDEYYFNDTTVMFFDPDNHEDLARSLVELSHDPEKRKSLAAQGSLFIEQNNWNRKKWDYIDIIHKLSSKPM
jgi:glycosyltransferase involved in cell wall biosynthesis